MTTFFAVGVTLFLGAILVAALSLFNKMAATSNTFFNTSMTLLDALKSYNRHDERVTELLGANNAYLERARAAEADFEALDKMTDAIEQENEALEAWQRVAIESNVAIDAYLREIKPDLPEHYGMPNDGVRIVTSALKAQIDAMSADNNSLVESVHLLEEELSSTKAALATEEAEANKYANLYHELKGKPEGVTAH